MNRFGILLLGAAMAHGALGCSDSTTTPTDAATPTDTQSGDGGCGMPVTPDGGRTPYYECASGPICPAARIMNDANTPNFRVTFLDIVAPEALHNNTIQGAVNGPLRNGTFLWGLSMNLTANTFKTGSLNPMSLTRGNVGLGLLDGMYQYFNNNASGMGMPNRYDPLSGTLSMADGRYSTGMVTTTVNLPIFNDDGSILTTLPLTNARIVNVALTNDRGCIGEARPSSGRFTENIATWNVTDAMDRPYGTIEADITVEAARMVNVTIAGSATPLCNILSGSNCATDMMAMWRNQPMMANGVPVYHLTANFAAVSARIAQ